MPSCLFNILHICNCTLCVLSYFRMQSSIVFVSSSPAQEAGGGPQAGRCVPGGGAGAASQGVGDAPGATSDRCLLRLPRLHLFLAHQSIDKRSIYIKNDLLATLFKTKPYFRKVNLPFIMDYDTLGPCLQRANSLNVLVTHIIWLFKHWCLSEVFFSERKICTS